ncbi:MAG: hypothetical protein J2P56_10835, partial [Verrucomicrobia bacterium]|nr:hypothetical protein [Verrucomicrobiota bacterium]
MIKKIANNTLSLFAMLKPWQMAKLPFVFSALAVWIAVTLGSQCLGGVVDQKSGASTDTRQVKTASSILATPARVNIAGPVASKEAVARPDLGRDQLRWLLIAALIVVLYIAVYLSVTGPVPSKFPLEPTTSPHPLNVTRNLILGLAAFICVDGVVFHTALYTSILAPDSYAGRIAVLTRAEKRRGASGLKEVLVLGDSRMAEGFSAPVA